MAKFLCKCGHVIYDQTDQIPYKGYYIPDTAIERLSDVLCKSIDTLIDAVELGKKEEWIEQNYSKEVRALQLRNSDLIHDLLTREILACTSDVFNCENCGRILLQQGQENRFKTYIEEPDN